MRTRVSGVVTGLLLLAACSPSATTTTTTLTAAPTTTTVATPSTVPTTTTTVPTTITIADGPTLLFPAFSAMGPAWSEQVFPYGEGEEFLGTAPGGEGLMLGPEYGTQTPDASWWFLDAAKTRVAHFEGDGTYLDQVPIPEDLLVDGQYFQYQMPQALDDGSIAAGGFRGETTMALLRVSGGEATGASFESDVPWVTTDGTYLYGLSLGDGVPYRLAPAAPEPEPVDWLLARDGSRYMVTIGEGDLIVDLPDTGVASILPMRYAEDPEVIARGGIEVETGADGTLFVLFYGVPETDETLGIGGFFSIGPDGTVSEVEPIVDPFSPSDPGSPAHLGMTPGTTTSWMMVVGEDGVHVWTRTG